MSLILTTLTAIAQPALWSGLGAVLVLLINKFIPSVVENKSNKREDFTSITSALFKEIDLLRADIDMHKVESTNCAKQYQELLDRFVDFKKSYNELELRYNIQLSINKKLGEEIRSLEDQVAHYLERDNLKIVDER